MARTVRKGNWRLSLLVFLITLTLFLSIILAQNPGHPANRIGGTTDAERTFASTGRYTFLGDLVVGGNLTVGSSLLFVNNRTGNVGIGTTNPTARLDVNGNIKWGTGRGLLATDQGASIELGGSGVPYIDFSNDMRTDFDMRIQLTGDDALLIDGGNVGIGVANPIQRLDVGGSIVVRDNIMVRNSTGGLEFLFSNGIIKEKFLPYCPQEITSDVYTNGQNQQTGCNFGGYTGYYDISNLRPENVKKGVVFGRGQVGTFEGVELNSQNVETFISNNCEIIGNFYLSVIPYTGISIYIAPPDRRLLVGEIKNLHVGVFSGTNRYYICAHGSNYYVGFAYLCPDSSGPNSKPPDNINIRVIKNSGNCVDCNFICRVIPTYTQTQQTCGDEGIATCDGNVARYCINGRVYQKTCAQGCSCETITRTSFFGRINFYTKCFCNEDKNNPPNSGWSCESIGLSTLAIDSAWETSCSYSQIRGSCGGGCYTVMTHMTNRCETSTTTFIGANNCQTNCRCVRQN